MNRCSLYVRREAACSESGMTLVELLVSIIILGIIGSAMGTVAFAGMRNHKATEDEQSSQAAIRKLSYYFPADARSADPSSVVVNGGSGVCSVAGPNLVQLQWLDNGVTYYSAYQLTGASLSRTYCTSAAPTPQTVVLGSGVAATASVASGAISLVLNSAATSYTASRELYRIRVVPRSAGGGGGGGGCAGSLDISPNPVARGGGNRLSTTVTLTFTVTSGTCAAPSFNVPANSNLVSNQPFPGSGPIFVATIPTSLNGWNGSLPQNFTVNVVVGATIITSTVLVVTA